MAENATSRARASTHCYSARLQPGTWHFRRGTRHSASAANRTVIQVLAIQVCGEDRQRVFIPSCHFPIPSVTLLTTVRRGTAVHDTAALQTALPVMSRQRMPISSGAIQTIETNAYHALESEIAGGGTPGVWVQVLSELGAALRAHGARGSAADGVPRAARHPRPPPSVHALRQSR